MLVYLINKKNVISFATLLEMKFPKKVKIKYQLKREQNGNFSVVCSNKKFIIIQPIVRGLTAADSRKSNVAHVPKFVYAAI